MKARWKITIGLAVAVAGVACAFLLWRPDSSEQNALEATRRDLRQQGFKIDLAEFNFSISGELRARAAALTNVDFIAGVPRGAARRSIFLQNQPDLMASVVTDAAIVVWKQDKLWSQSGRDLWATLREALDEDRSGLDAACEAALSGPIRFNLVASRGSGMLLAHLATLKRLAQSLATRAVLELHGGNKDAAWTNLLASTRLVTAYEPEPAEISHLVRFGCATIAFNATWQILQADGWADDRLAQLQREWESADFFRGLPETAAFTRASMVTTCQLERQQPMPGLGVALQQALRSPRYAWSALTDYWRRLDYRHHGTYEDEKALLLYYRDRELELRRAARSSTWSEMRPLPGVTNAVYFQSKYPSRMQSMLHVRQIVVASAMYGQNPGRGQNYGLLSRAADAEARRRLIVTAIALERYRRQHGSYPNTLQELAPGLLKEPPTDFMDGKPLHYRRTDDGHFVLYSVGLDCADDGGLLPQSPQRRSAYGEPPRRAVARQTDLVWPRPASAAEFENSRREELKAQAEAADRSDDLQAEEQWRHSAKRQAGVEKLLAAKLTVHSTEPVLHDRRLSEVLRNENAHDTSQLTLNELLVLKQVVTGEEPETVTFEAPMNYNVLTNLGNLQLYVDPAEDEDSDEGCLAGESECRRATNGNCLLVWRTIYESPGKHAVQMRLELNESDRSDEPVVGPVAPFVVSNLCQFSLSSAHFNPAFGATLRAKLPESNGTYTVEISTPSGERLRTLTGGTSDGIMKVFWNLTDEHGRKCTNNAYDTLIHLTLPDSGRSQTLRGP